MNGDNKKANSREHLEQGRRAFEAAQVLFEKGFYEDGISRAYYAALYHTLALLLTLGAEPKSHEGAFHLFNLHFIKTGLIEPEYRTLLKKAQKWRLESDYKARRFTKEEASLEMNEVKKFLARVSDYLHKGGF